MKTRDQIVDALRDAAMANREWSWEAIADAAIEATGYECAPEKPERPEWWGTRLSISDYGWIVNGSYAITVSERSSDDQANRAALIASHNRRVELEEGVRRLVSLHEPLPASILVNRELLVSLRRLLDEAE